MPHQRPSLTTLAGEAALAAVVTLILLAPAISRAGDPTPPPPATGETNPANAGRLTLANGIWVELDHTQASATGKPRLTIRSHNPNGAELRLPVKVQTAVKPAADDKEMFMSRMGPMPVIRDLIGTELVLPANGDATVTLALPTAVPTGTALILVANTGPLAQKAWVRGDRMSLMMEPLPSSAAVLQLNPSPRALVQP